MDESSPEPPQQIMLLKKHEPEKLLRDLSVCLGCDLESFREKFRVDKTFKKEYDGISALIKM